MKIWGNNNGEVGSSGASPSSTPLAEKAKTIITKNKASNSATNNQFGFFPTIPSPETYGSTDGADTFTTSDDATKYKLNPEQLKMELRERRQMVEDTSSSPSPSAVDVKDEANATDTAERDEPAPSSSNNNSSSHRQSIEDVEPKKAGLGRMLFGGGSKEQQPAPAASRDQIKVIYRQFGPDAAEVLTVEHDAGGMPSPNGPDHVVVKIQVRAGDFR